MGGQPRIDGRLEVEAEAALDSHNVMRVADGNRSLARARKDRIE